MSSIVINQRYRLINRAHRKELAYVTPHDVIPHGGQAILFGVLNAQGMAAKPCAFPVFPQERGDTVEQLMAVLGSAPLYLELEEDRRLVLPNGQRLNVHAQNDTGRHMPVLNVPRRMSQPLTKDDLLRRAAQLIQVYQEWKHLGHVVPFWFKDILDKEKRPAGMAA